LKKKIIIINLVIITSFNDDINTKKNIGIDVGSQNTEIVLADTGKEIIVFTMIQFLIAQLM
jgi:hypothetical protein